LADWKTLYEKWVLLSEELQEKLIAAMDTKAKEKPVEFKKWLLEDAYREKIYFEKLPSDRRFILASPREIGAVAVSSVATVSEVSRVVEVSKVSEVSRVVEVSKSVGVSPVGVGVLPASVEEVGALPKAPEAPVAAPAATPEEAKPAEAVPVAAPVVAPEAIKPVEVTPKPEVPVDLGVVKPSEVLVEAVSVPPASAKVVADVQKRRRLDNAIRKLETNPTLGIPLLGSLSGKRSLTIGGYRIIYAVDPQEKTIVLYAARRRKKI
jgi:mRNA-degrading endonuclease RelE of RelBE toxin-antitoxin system